jgi:phosphomethylpyrimidine synthase
MNKPILDKSLAITRGALPGSKKLMLNGVPFREVPLSGGEPPVRLYDTSGPYTEMSRNMSGATGSPRTTA